MELEFTWLLLAIPMAFAFGWMASRFDWRQLRIDNRSAPKAYFRGLNHLLNEQQDQAIDAFIEAVQSDPDTSELHFALGNLFRRRGEFDRAVRVHEHLIARGDLSSDDRHRAQHALALDFLKAGLLDRAEGALRQLQGTRFEGQAGLALLALYERTRDWNQAHAIASRLQSSAQGNFAGRIAHYRCEQAQALVEQGDTEGARRLLREATVQSPESPRPWIELAGLQARHDQQPGAAFATLIGALDRVAPLGVPLLASRLAGVALAPEQVRTALDRLQRHYESFVSFDVLDAIIQLTRRHMQAEGKGAQEQAAMELQMLERHLQGDASLATAVRWLQQAAANTAAPRAPIEANVLRALEQAARPALRYRCAACGFEAQQHLWQCPGCLAWDSYPPRRVEEL